MKGIGKLTKVITKIGEVIHWIGMVAMAALAVAAGIVPEQLASELASEGNVFLSVYGFEVQVMNGAGQFDSKALMLFAIGGFFVLFCMAMILRNIYLIVKRSEGSTPFQKDNVRMLREIGIFSIAIPVISLVMSTVIRFVIGGEALDLSVNLNGWFIGVIVLCFMQFFAHGVELEADVNGLL